MLCRGRRGGGRVPQHAVAVGLLVVQAGKRVIGQSTSAALGWPWEPAGVANEPRPQILGNEEYDRRAASIQLDRATRCLWEEEGGMLMVSKLRHGAAPYRRIRCERMKARSWGTESQRDCK
jgi:hypothetical protein